MSHPQDRSLSDRPGADAGSRADVVHITPAAAAVAAKFLEPQADAVDLVIAANEAARAVHTAARIRDKTIRRALAAGAEVHELATATGLSVEQLGRIQRSD